MEAEDFLVADSNAEAVGWLDRWPDWPAPALVIHGPAGCGKTHLTQVWRARSRAVPLAAEELAGADLGAVLAARSEEHTSELQSLMRISYAVFCLKKKNKPQNSTKTCIKILNQYQLSRPNCTVLYIHTHQQFTIYPYRIYI